MSEYFVYISGEHPPLAKAEIETLLKLVDSKSQISWYGRLGRYSSEQNWSQFLLSRAAFLSEAGKVIFEGRVEDIIKTNSNTGQALKKVFSITILRTS